MSKRAIILAGGLGTRLRPYTTVLPKPLMPIGEYPILEVVIRQLSYFDFDHITLAVNHQAELLKSYFGDGSRWKTFIDYSLEKKPLGTMGPLHLISDLPENFLVMNGDVLTDLNFADFYEQHSSSDVIFTISSKRREAPIEYGVLEVGDERRLTGFQEKPKLEFEVSMGVYMVNRSIKEHIPEDTPFGFDDLMENLIKAEKNVRVNKHDGYWLDIGRAEDYRTAIDEFEEMKSLFLHE